MPSKDIVIIAPTPKGMDTGLSVAVRCLVDGLEEREIPHTIVDTIRWGVPEQPGRLNIRRAFESFMTVLEATGKIARARNVYLTLSTSKGGFLRGAVSIFWASILRRRVVVHLHGGGFADFYASQGTRFQSFIRRTMQKATCIVSLGELLIEQFAMVPAYREKVVVIPNGFPANIAVPPIRPRKLEADEPMRILYISNLVPSKGVLFLLRAVEQLREEGIKIRLDIAGNLKDVCGSDEDDYQDFITDFEDACERLGECCTYHGSVFGEKKEKLFEGAHVFCLPTFYPWEGQPISIIEALAYGLPVIATPHKGIPEQVIDGFNGFLVKPKSSSAIMAAMKAFDQDHELYESFSVAARKHFDGNFTREVHQERLIRCILGET